MDFDEAYAPNNCNRYPGPATQYFIGSYPPVTPPGELGCFFVNSYYLRPDRKSELGGPVPVRSNDIKNKKLC